ncbi:hypothetical protein B0H11DRAFT_2115601, partial [Mycena galericulata]
NNLQDASRAFGITGVVLTATFLLSMAYAAWNTASRPHLNRISFRLLVCALISNLIFAVSFIPVFSGSSAGCSFMAFFGVSPHVLSVHVLLHRVKSATGDRALHQRQDDGKVLLHRLRGEWILSLDLCVYSLRPILYALLAAGDPHRAVHRKKLALHEAVLDEQQGGRARAAGARKTIDDMGDRGGWVVRGAEQRGKGVRGEECGESERRRGGKWEAGVSGAGARA